MKISEMTETEMKIKVVDLVMDIHGMKEYRDRALQTEFIFYGMMHVPDAFNDKFEMQELDNELAQYYIITDAYENHVPWPFLISDLMAPVPFHGGPYDKEIWEMAFSFMGGKNVYLTHNLWTCNCVNTQYIWDIDTICCPLCGCVEDDESMEILKSRIGCIDWKPKSNRLPYLHKLFEYPLEEYDFDLTQLAPLMNETSMIHHGAPVTLH